MMKNVKRRIGLIGTGRMGTALGSRLLDVGSRLFVTNRTESRASTLVSRGARWCASPRALAESVDTVLLCVSGPAATDWVLGEWLDAAASRDPWSIVDLSTISPEAATLNAHVLQAWNASYVSCPVSGGVDAARAGRLTAILGPAKRVDSRIRGVVEAFASTIVHTETHEAALQLKILNNLAEAINLWGASEVLRAAQGLGLGFETSRRVFESARGHSAYMRVMLDYLASRQRDSGVSLNVRTKDVRLAMNELATLGAGRFPLSSLIAELFGALANRLGDDFDQCSCFTEARGSSWTHERSA